MDELLELLEADDQVVFHIILTDRLVEVHDLIEVIELVEVTDQLPINQ